MKKDWRNLSWKDLNGRQRMLFIALCVLCAWMLVMALFYKVWNIPDWVVYLWIGASAPVLYCFHHTMSAYMDETESPDDDSDDE